MQHNSHKSNILILNELHCKICNIGTRTFSTNIGISKKVTDQLPWLQQVVGFTSLSLETAVHAAPQIYQKTYKFIMLDEMLLC